MLYFNIGDYWTKAYPEKSLLASYPPLAPSNGEPHHLFLAQEDESALTRKLILWGGYNGIASFEGTFRNDLQPVDASTDAAADIAWLRTFPVPAFSNRETPKLPVFRFICVPKVPYTDHLPTGSSIVKDLCYSGNFKSSNHPNLDTHNIAYARNLADYSDQIHTVRRNQWVFPNEALVYRLKAIGAMQEMEKAEDGVKAHTILEEYVRDKRLYYAIFHTKEHDAHKAAVAKEHPKRKVPISKKDVYMFAVGVSPHGNLVGAVTMHLSAGFTAVNFEDVGDSDFEYDTIEKAHPDAGAFCNNLQTDLVPDGSPQHIFYREENESLLSRRLMLYGGYKGVVSFEGMLPVEPDSDTQLDMIFVRSLLDPPISMHFGCAHAPVFAFICIPDSPYLGEMPSESDIIRDLCNEEHFCSRGRGSYQSCQDELHCSRDRQLIFSTKDRIKNQEKDGDPSEEIRIAMENGAAALEKLENFVRDKRLYYAVFHTRPHKRVDFITCDNLYAFAVGVSPKTGNLVGFFCMQSSRNMTD